MSSQPPTPDAAEPAPAAGSADPAPVEPLLCSAKGCRAPATWALAWNNPKVHEPRRRKTWLACDAHLDYLSDFLNRRGFLRETTTIGPTRPG